MTGGPAYAPPSYAPPTDTPPPGPAMAAVTPPAARAAPGSLAGRFGNSQRATSGPVDPALLPGAVSYDASGQGDPERRCRAPVPAGDLPPPALSMAAAPPAARAVPPGNLAGRFGNSQYATSGPIDPALLSGGAAAPAAQPTYPPGVTPPPPMTGGSADLPPAGPSMAVAPPPAARAAPGSLAGRFGNSQRATSGPVDAALLPGGSGYDASGQPAYSAGATPPPMSGPAMRGAAAGAAGGSVAARARAVDHRRPGLRSAAAPDA